MGGAEVGDNVETGGPSVWEPSVEEGSASMTWSWTTCSLLGSFSIASAIFSRSLTSLVLFVRCPPRQINIADMIPQRNVTGMSVAVVQAGRRNLCDAVRSYCIINHHPRYTPIESPHTSAEYDLHNGMG